jgi:hypothetical protein
MRVDFALCVRWRWILTLPLDDWITPNAATTGPNPNLFIGPAYNSSCDESIHSHRDAVGPMHPPCLPSSISRR